jgi:hypothetical protein
MKLSEPVDSSVSSTGMDIWSSFRRLSALHDAYRNGNCHITVGFSSIDDFIPTRGILWPGHFHFFRELAPPSTPPQTLMRSRAFLSSCALYALRQRRSGGGPRQNSPPTGLSPSTSSLQPGLDAPTTDSQAIIHLPSHRRCARHRDCPFRFLRGSGRKASLSRVSFHRPSSSAGAERDDIPAGTL